MEVSGVSGGSALQSAQKAAAGNVAGGVEESTEKKGGSVLQKGNEESNEGSQAVQAASKESGVGGNVNIKV